MPDLKPITALGSDAPRSLSSGSLTLEENPALALASVSLRRNALKPSPFGLDLPGPGGWTGSQGVSAFWTGPGQWMIEGHHRADSDFAVDVTTSCPGCSVTEQTDGFAAFEVRSSTGEKPILRLMEKLVNIDASRFPGGSATRTGLEHMSVFVIRRAPDRVAVLGMRSAAGSIWHALEVAILRLNAAAA